MTFGDVVLGPTDSTSSFLPPPRRGRHLHLCSPWTIEHLPFVVFPSTERSSLVWWHESKINFYTTIEIENQYPGVRAGESLEKEPKEKQHSWNCRQPGEVTNKPALKESLSLSGSFHRSEQWAKKEQRKAQVETWRCTEKHVRSLTGRMDDGATARGPHPPGSSDVVWTGCVVCSWCQCRCCHHSDGLCPLGRDFHQKKSFNW